MNKKSILNRTLPLIVAILVLLVAGICIVVFSGDKKTPMVDNKDDAYLTVNLGSEYDKPIIIKKEELYGKLKNGTNGLTFLVNILDTKLLTEKGYVQKVTDEEIVKAIEEDIFGKDYEFDPENLDADNDKIENYVEKMYLSYGMEISDNSIQIKDSALSVSLTNDAELKEYYTLSLARKAYTRDQMGEDQKTSYEEFIKAYEDYLVELYKYEEGDITTAPTIPVDASTVTSSSVQADFEKENADEYWSLVVKYSTKAEAEQALLQEGVVIYNSKWYKYEGIIDLDDYKDENGGRQYKTLASYYNAKGIALNKFEIQSKLIELYNNSVKANERLYSGTNYEIKELTKAEYDKLDDSLKDEKYTEFKGTDGAESSYKAVIFKSEAKLDEEGKATDDRANALFYDLEKQGKLDSSILSYIKSLSALYTDGSSWAKCYSNSIQAKGSYYVLAFKFETVEAVDFDDEEAFGKFYDKEKFEDGVAEDAVNELKLGYVPYTRNEDGELTFDYSNNKYWEKVEKLLDDAVNSTKVNEYMAELRNDNGLIIYDALIEASYMSTYTSEYEATKKSSKDVVAKLTIVKEDGSKEVFKVTAEDLYKDLEAALGGITAADAYQYHNVLSQNDVIDYNKYLNGADLDDCVIITEYALAKPGTTDPVTKWVKADHDGLVEFKKVDGTAEYDVIVRKGVKGEEKTIEKFEAHEIEIDDESAKKTTITVTVSNEAHYHDPENTYLGLDDTIASLKIYFTNGNFADYGYDASYGWTNFLRDYFLSYYGITVKTNEDLKLYYIYEHAVEHISEELAKADETKWNEYYLPFMQQAYDNYFSVDAIHFLISVNNEEGNISDPNAEDTAWTAEQKAAAEELYEIVYSILRKTKSTAQAGVLEDIVDAIDSAPKFIADVEQTTEAQQNYINENPLYVEKDENGEVLDTVIKYTAEIKGKTLEVSKYKTLGLNVKYENLGTVTAGKMVKPFEDALRTMWTAQQINDNGMQTGTALESNEFYDEYAQEGEYLITEYGYHVLVANKFTGRATAANDGKEDKKEIVTLPSFEQVQIYEKDGEEVDTLLDYAITQVETYYSPIVSDFESSYWYQADVMTNLIADLEAGNKLTFANEAAKERTLKTAKYYVDTYYTSLTYVSKGYDYAMDLMEIFVNAYNNYVFSIENAEAAYVENYVISEANLKIILATAEKAVASISELDLNDTELKDYKELKDKFDDALVAFKK